MSSEKNLIAPDHGVKVPSEWSVQTDKAIGLVDTLSEDLGDPALKPILEQALGKNFNIKAAVARREAALSTFKISNASLLPVIGLSGDYSQTINEFGKTNIRSERTNLSANISWEPDLWGKLSNLTKAELETLKASDADLEGLKLSLSVNIARFWFNAVEKKLQITLAEQRVESFKKNLNIINKGYEKGVYTELDIRLALSDLAAAENSIQEEREAFDKILRALQVLLGEYPDLKMNLPDAMVTIGNSVPGGLPSDLMIRRPDLLKAEHQLMASKLKRKAAEKNWLPSFQLTGSGGLTSSEFARILNPESLFITLLAKISQPVFNGDKLEEERNRAQYFVDELLAQYAQTLLVAFQEVETALARVAYLENQELLLKKSWKEAIRAEELALERYLAGLNDVLVYLDAQRRTYETNRTLLILANKKIQNRLDLYLALGGGFTSLHNKEL